MDCKCGKQDPGTNVIGWPHHGKPNQQWELVPLSANVPTKCILETCFFFKHATKDHGYCCKKCKEGKAHGKNCGRKYIPGFNQLSDKHGQIFSIKNKGSGLFLEINESS
jgi:hypothetical protein